MCTSPREAYSDGGDAPAPPSQAVAAVCQYRRQFDHEQGDHPLRDCQAYGVHNHEYTPTPSPCVSDSVYLRKVSDRSVFRHRGSQVSVNCRRIASKKILEAKRMLQHGSFYSSTALTRTIMTTYLSCCHHSDAAEPHIPHPRQMSPTRPQEPGVVPAPVARSRRHADTRILAPSPMGAMSVGRNVRDPAACEGTRIAR